MQRIFLHEDIRPLSEFRAKAAEFIAKLRKNKRPIVLTQNGKSSAVLLDVNEYESLISRLELLEDVREAEADIAAGRTLSHADAKEKIRASQKQ